LAAPLPLPESKPAKAAAQSPKAESKCFDLSGRTNPLEQNLPQPADQAPKRFDLSGRTKPLENNPPLPSPNPEPTPQKQKKQKTNLIPPAQTPQTPAPPSTAPAQSSPPVQPPPPPRFRVKANNRVFGGQISVHLKGGMLQIDGKPITATKMAIVLGNPDQIGADGTIKRTEQHIILTGR
jgi:hypothetical protein